MGLKQSSSISAFAPELSVCWQRGLRPNKAKFAAAPDRRGSLPEAPPAIKAQEQAMCALTQSPQCFLPIGEDNKFFVSGTFSSGFLGVDPA